MPANLRVGAALPRADCNRSMTHADMPILSARGVTDCGGLMLASAVRAVASSPSAFTFVASNAARALLTSAAAASTWPATADGSLPAAALRALIEDSPVGVGLGFLRIPEPLRCRRCMRYGPLGGLEALQGLGVLPLALAGRAGTDGIVAVQMLVGLVPEH
jgi:hypothetical protein